jgi:hypothetical protein
VTQGALTVTVPPRAPAELQSLQPRLSERITAMHFIQWGST